MAYIPNPDNFIAPAQKQTPIPPLGSAGQIQPKTYLSNASSGPKTSQGSVLSASSSQPVAQLAVKTPQPQSPQPQNNPSKNVVSRDYALSKGWDTNNMPSGYIVQEDQPRQSVDMGALAEQEYNNTMDYLNGVENWMRGQYTDAINTTNSVANTNAQTVTKSADQYKQEQQANKDKAFRQKEDALSAARKLYEEMQMASRQRFGGATSAGQASNELLNAEQMRLQGQAQSQYADYIQQADLAANKVQQGITEALASIAQNAENARKSALSEFTSKMLEISQKKGEASTLKNQRKLEALYQLRNQQYQINMQEKQFQQQIELARAKNEQNVSIQRANQQGAFAVLGSSMNLNPQTQYKIGQTTFTTNSSPLWVGQIKKFVIGDDEQGRTVYWDPATQNFDFGWTKFDANANPMPTDQAAPMQ